MDSQESAVLEMSLRSVLKKNCTEPPDAVLQRIEVETGIRVQAIDRANGEQFLAGVATELRKSMADWKVQFVIGVMRSLIARHY